MYRIRRKCAFLGKCKTLRFGRLYFCELFYHNIAATIYRIVECSKRYIFTSENESSFHEIYKDIALDVS